MNILVKQKLHNKLFVENLDKSLLTTVNNIKIQNIFTLKMLYYLNQNINFNKNLNNKMYFHNVLVKKKYSKLN